MPLPTVLIGGKILLCRSIGFSLLFSKVEPYDESASLFKATSVESYSKQQFFGVTSVFSLKTTRSSECALQGSRFFMILSTMLVRTIFLGALSTGESSLMTFSTLCWISYLISSVVFYLKYRSSILNFSMILTTSRLSSILARPIFHIFANRRSLWPWGFKHGQNVFDKQR